jgi:exopolysaccharide biosynthesis predicted pyruvyltransferase EpsI
MSADLLDDLAARTRSAVAAAVPASTPIALVNFPNHRNAGDPALWLGGMLALRRAGARIRYVCDPESYDPVELRRRLGDQPVVAIGGGGNLGDRYLRQQRARERVMEDFPRGRFVQLPQSIDFQDQAEQDRVGRLMADRELVLMVRERRSEQRARDMGLDPILVPDAALQLGALRLPVAPRVDVLWQHRDDPEQSRPNLDPTELFEDGVTVEVRDWLRSLHDDEEPPTRIERLAHAAESRAAAAAVADGRARTLAPSVLRWAYPQMSRHWTRRGVHVLALGRVVVTDRLHGHLLSLMAGIPHVALNNATGKVHDTLELWTGDHPLVHRAEDPAEAAAHAVRLLAQA